MHFSTQSFWFVGDQGSKLGLGQVGRSELQLLGVLREQGHELVGDGLLDADHREGHAALAGAAVGGVDDALHRPLEDAVLQDEGVVLRLGQSLDALPGPGGGLVDMLADLGRADEGDAADVGVDEEAIRLDPAAGDEAHHPLGEPGLDEQLEHPDGRLGHHGSGLQDEGVPGGDAEGEHPAHGDHGREIVGGDADEDPERLSEGDRVVALGDVHAGVALHEVMGRAGALDHLDGLEHVALRLREHLAHLGGEERRELVEVLVEELLEPEHELDALGDGGVRPAGVGPGRRGHRRVHLLLRAAGGFRDLLACRGVHDRHELLGPGLPPLVVHAVAEPLVSHCRLGSPVQNGLGNGHRLFLFKKCERPWGRAPLPLKERHHHPLAET